MNDFSKDLGILALPLKLRRISDQLHEHGRRVYRQLDLPLEPSWYALLLLLRQAGPLPVTEAAGRLRLTHPAVIDMAGKMEKAGLVVAGPDPADRRRRVLRLSKESLTRIPRFEKVWEAFGRALSELGGDLPVSLAALESDLEEEGLDRRVLRLLREEKPVRQQFQGRFDIRPLFKADRNAVLRIARELVRAGDTYAYDPEISDDELWRYWAPKENGNGYAAVLDREVLGIFVIKPNQPGPGSHLANASYAVRADTRGLGLGRRMGEASLQLASEQGYQAMQFNIVVSTNSNAIRLWKSLGFRIVGTIPEGFTLPDGRKVAHHIMYRRLE